MTWRDRLRAAYREHTRINHPDFYTLSGGAKMKTKTWEDSTANGLTKCIIDWITYDGGFASRVNTTGMMRKIGGQMRWTKGSSVKGLADIMATINGRAVHIEVKIGRDRMSDDQKKVKAKVEASGGLYFIAKDMYSFLDWYDEQFPAAAATLTLQTTSHVHQ